MIPIRPYYQRYIKCNSRYEVFIVNKSIPDGVTSTCQFGLFQCPILWIAMTQG